MSRTARIVLPGYPHHVVHRGHNRQSVFRRATDFSAYLEDLRELKARFGVKVHAWCLMPNHVHLLMVPDTADGLEQVMKRLAGRHAVRLNLRDRNTGALWQGRYFSSLVDRDSYFLTCCHYIELNPVRASMVADPADYRWSSCRSRMTEARAGCLDLDPLFLEMGTTASERWRTYRAGLMEPIADDRRKLIREAIQRGQLTGNRDFVEAIERTLGRRVERRGPGRPPKNQAQAENAENRSVPINAGK